MVLSYKCSNVLFKNSGVIFCCLLLFTIVFVLYFYVVAVRSCIRTASVVFVLFFYYNTAASAVKP